MSISRRAVVAGLAAAAVASPFGAAAQPASAAAPALPLTPSAPVAAAEVSAPAQASRLVALATFQVERFLHGRENHLTPQFSAAEDEACRVARLPSWRRMPTAQKIAAFREIAFARLGNGLAGEAAATFFLIRYDEPPGYWFDDQITWSLCRLRGEPVPKSVAKRLTKRYADRTHRKIYG